MQISQEDWSVISSDTAIEKWHGRLSLMIGNSSALKRPFSDRSAEGTPEPMWIPLLCFALRVRPNLSLEGYSLLHWLELGSSW
jgi:hypothetical protein